MRPTEAVESGSSLRSGQLVGVLWLSCMAAIAVVLLGMLHATPGPTRLLEGLNLALGCLVVLMATVNGFRPIMAVYGVFSLCWLGIAPVVQIEVHQSAWNDWSTVTHSGDANTALLLGSGMYAALLIGALWGDARGGRPDRTGQFRASSHDISPLAIVGLALALLLLTPVVVKMQGGVGALFIDRNARAEVLAGASLDTSDGSGVGNGLAVLLPGSMAVALGHLTWRASRQWRRTSMPHMLVVALGALVSLMGLALFNNPLSNTRFIAAVGLGSIALALAAPRGRWAGRFMGVLLMFVVLVIYPLGAIIGGRDSSMPGLGGALTGMDFDGFQQVINTLHHVRAHGFGDGLHVISAILFMVPRSLWVAKARPATFEVAQTAGYSFQNLSLPFHAELYLDFGLVGMLLLGVAYGFAIGYLDNAWLTRPTSNVALFVPLAALSQLAVLRGPLGSLTPVYLTPLVLIWIGVVVSRMTMDEFGLLRRFRHCRTRWKA